MGDYELLPGRRDFIRKLLMTGLLVAAPWWPSGRVEGATRVGEVLPKATLINLKGNRTDIPSDFRGRILIVHFWATWCPYCAKEVALLESLFHGYRAKGVLPLSVNVGESRETVVSFMEKQNVSYPILTDPDSSVARQYGITGIPTTFVLNREGVVKFRIIGEVTGDGLRKIVKSLL